MGVFKQEYWSGWPFPPLGDLPDPGIKSSSPLSLALRADSLPFKDDMIISILYMRKQRLRKSEKLSMGIVVQQISTSRYVLTPKITTKTFDT